MVRKRVGSRFGSAGGGSAIRLDPLLCALGLFAAWVVARIGVDVFLFLEAEVIRDVRTNITDRDFANYWVGARLAISGQHLLLFDHDRYFAHLIGLFGPDYQIHSWSYPPHFLMLVAPLGLMEYRPALLLFLAFTLALFVLAVRAFSRHHRVDGPAWQPWLFLFGYVLMMLQSTQNGFLTASLILVTLTYKRERPAIAGFALALLTMKPQLGFLIPLLALFDRDWPLLRWASGYTVALVGLSLWLFGAQSWEAFFSRVIPYQNFVMNEWHGGFLWMMPSAFGSLRTLGVDSAVASPVQLIVSLAALGATVRLLMIVKDPLDRCLVLLAGTFLITPYAFNYDMGALSVVAACCALRERALKRFPRAWLYAWVAVAPAMITWLAEMGMPLTPLLLAGVFAMQWTGARRAQPAISSSINAAS